MQHEIDSANMSDHTTSQEASDEVATLCSLPHDILKNIIRELSFKDKFSLELVGRGFHHLLSHASSVEGLWGTCDFVSDLALDDRFYRSLDITR